MTERQVGFTPPALNPPYINVHEIPGDKVRVTVRSPNSADANLLVSQLVAYIDMTKREWHQFVTDIDNELFSHMFGGDKSSPIFRDHSCWKCNDGAKPCAAGSPSRCEYPHARND